ncbi:hypothetical protein NFI96_019933, partial [Prochilodus magdalenae]
YGARSAGLHDSLELHHLQLLRDSYSRERSVAGQSQRSVTACNTGAHPAGALSLEQFRSALSTEESWNDRMEELFSEARPSRPQLDSTCDGHIGWETLCTYVLQQPEQSGDTPEANNMDISEPVIRHCLQNKQEPVTRILEVSQPPPLRYISVSKGGTLTVWNSRLQVIRSLETSSEQRCPPCTIGRQLHHAGLHPHRPLPRLSLTPRHRHQTLQWCRTRLSWSDSEWQRVIFSDESRFSPGGDAQRIRVWRHRGQHQDERFAVTRPEDLVSLHLHPYRTICRNSFGGSCVSWFQLCGHVGEKGSSSRRFRSWMTDAVYMPNVHKVAVASVSRNIHLIDVSTSACFEEWQLCGLSHAATALCYWYSVEAPGERCALMWGDERGAVSVLWFLQPHKGLFETPFSSQGGPQQVFLSDICSQTSLVSYQQSPKIHSEPINRVRYEPRASLIATSSESSASSVVIMDVDQRRSSYVWKVEKGVQYFDISWSLSLLVTAGLDPALRLWNRYVTSRPVAVLHGHRTTVVDVTIYPDLRKIFSYSKDAVLKIWDIPTQRCVKTLPLRFPNIQTGRIPEQGSFPLLLSLAGAPALLVSCREYLALLRLQNSASSRGAAAFSCTLYIPHLRQVVTACADSSVVVWEVETGRKRLELKNAHGQEEITAMTADHSQRRLITAASNGTIKVWSLLNGHPLHKLEAVSDTEVTGVICLHDNQLLSVGWSRLVAQYSIGESHDVYVKADVSWKSGRLHSEDILTADHCPGLRMLATGSYDGEIIVWTLDTQRPVTRLQRPEPGKTPTGPPQSSVGHSLVLHQWTQDAAPQDAAHRTLPHRMLPTGRCPTGCCPTGRCPQDGAQRTVPKGCCPTGCCPKDAGQRMLPTGCCPQDTAHRTVPKGCCPTGRCPKDAGQRMLPTGRCPQDAPHRMLPTGQSPQDAAQRTPPKGRSPQDAPHRMLPTGCSPQDAAHRMLPTGRSPQDAPHRTIPTGRRPKENDPPLTSCLLCGGPVGVLIIEEQGGAGGCLQMAVLVCCRVNPPVDRLRFLQKRTRGREWRNRAVLLSSQAGSVCWWSVCGPPHNHAEFYAPHRSDERVKALCTNHDNSVLITGDTTGSVQLWDISQYGLSDGDEPVNQQPPLIKTWRAHEGAIVSMEVLEHDSQLFLVSVSVDHAARLWTAGGGCVGSFGQECYWDLNNPQTYQVNRYNETELSSSSDQEEKDMTETDQSENIKDISAPGDRVQGPGAEVGAARSPSEELCQTTVESAPSSEDYHLSIQTLDEWSRAQSCSSSASSSPGHCGKVALGGQVIVDFQRKMAMRQDRRKEFGTIDSTRLYRIGTECTPFQALKMQELGQPMEVPSRPWMLSKSQSYSRATELSSPLLSSDSSGTPDPENLENL